MAWVRLWVKSNCAGNGATQDVYVWYDDLPDEYSLKITTEDWAHTKYGHSHYGFKYGFEIVDKIPEYIRLEMIQKFEFDRDYAESILKHLKES